MLSDYLDRVFADCIRSEADLDEEQREAVEFLWNNPFSALYLDVGFGKTAITLTVMDRLWLRGYRGKFLIIAPIRVATRVWPYEPRLWSHLAYMGSTVIRVDDADLRLNGFTGMRRTAEKARLRRALLDSSEQIHIINQEAVDWLVTECAARGAWPYATVIFDEASRLRDHGSVVFKALKRVRPHIKRFHQLTATPASQTYMHLFSQIYLLDLGERFGKNITPFRERYFTYNPYRRTWTIREGAAEEIERLISDICLVMRRKKDFRISIRSIRLPDALMHEYESFERDLVLELPDDKAIDAINGAVLCSKLLQFASGAVYDQDKQTHFIHNEKIEELKSLLDETLDEPVMVAYWFKSSLERLQKAFPYAVTMDREGAREKPWNERKHKLMLVHPQSVGHGLNLQHGGHHIVLFDLFYSLELYTQLIGRLDRRSQTHTVRVHLLSVCGSMDEVVSANLQNLQNAEESMFRRLQDIRRGLSK
jgi:SNF2 family DNA or RNA helicase